MTPKDVELFFSKFSSREILHLPGPVYFEKLTEAPVTTEFQGGVRGIKSKVITPNER